MACKFHSTIILALYVALFFREATSSCNPFRGNWVFDKSYPLYNPTSCPFVRRDFDCVKFGRPDQLYLKYRWQPDSCDLPRFDGMDLLNKLRGKRIMFVGDSLSANQYESLLCLIHSAAPNVKTTNIRVPNQFVGVRFEGYNVTVEYYITHYLVDIVSKPIGDVLELGSLSGGPVWQAVDVLIFNTGHWWAKKSWNFTQDGNKIVKDMDSLLAFTKALQTWAKWVDQNIDPSRTKVFYQSMSPDHNHGQDWGASSRANCMRETQPITNSSQYIAGPMPQEAIVKNIIRSISKPVYLLDITYLSQLRKDGHPSKYHGVVPGIRIDCSHWCAPGVPDTWNQLLYNALLH